MLQTRDSAAALVSSQPRPHSSSATGSARRDLTGPDRTERTQPLPPPLRCRRGSRMIAAQLLAYYFTELKDDQLKKVSGRGQGHSERPGYVSALTGSSGARSSLTAAGPGARLLPERRERTGVCREPVSASLLLPVPPPPPPGTIKAVSRKRTGRWAGCETGVR